jgi:hypothetical protein
MTKQIIIPLTEDIVQNSPCTRRRRAAGHDVFVFLMPAPYCFGFSDFMLSCFIFMLQQLAPAL